MFSVWMVFTSNLSIQTSWLKVKFKLVNLSWSVDLTLGIEEDDLCSELESSVINATYLCTSSGTYPTALKSKDWNLQRINFKQLEVGTTN